MKRCFYLFFCLVLCLVLCVSAFAVDDVPAVSSGETLTAETEVEGNNITVNVVMPDTGSPDVDSTDMAAVVEAPADSGASGGYATYTLDDAAPAGTNTMSDVVTALFGTYSPRTQTVTEYLSDGTSVTYQQYVPGAAGVDWAWVSGLSLFALCLWSFFCLVGGVVKRV